MIKRHLFLSHSARDAALAGRLEKALAKLGFSTFDPTRDIKPGDDWRASIHAAIRRSDVLLLLVASPDSAATSWMGYEAGIAEALGKRVVALVSDRFSLAQIPSDFAGRWVLRMDPNAPERTAQDVAYHLAAA